MLFLSRNILSGGSGQLDIHAMLDQWSRDHKNNQQHQHHVHKGGDIDLAHGRPVFV